ncbi:dual serine/threonine and tyrosine protein kinase-like, partial [Anneissia japonica]|uniref:dual serine/threonine and tyrosine protein kinase-like n=1 Tax=Anneissia japonica TaxID=1529436 RepID=UPI00142579D4
CQDSVLPIVLYGISDELLSYSDLSDLIDLRSCLHDLPVLFIKTKNSNAKLNGALPKSTVTDPINQGARLNQNQVSTPPQTEPPQRQTSKASRVYYPKAIRSPIFKQKERKAQTSPRINAPSQNGLGLSQQLHNIGFLRTTSTLQSRHRNNINNSTSKLLDDLKNVGGIIMFVKNTLQLYVIKSTTAMQNMHIQSMNMFITTAFDMAREIQITPKRIDYARQQEEELYKKLLEINSQKQEEIKHLISETIANMKEDLLLEAECYQFVGIKIPKKGEACQQKDIKRCQQQIQELVVNKVNTAVVEKLIGSVDYLRESFVGTLTRCLENLEQADSERESSASMALRQILNASYQVEVSAQTSSSFIRVIWEQMKWLGLKTMPWKYPPKVDAEWQKKVVLEMISSLSESKLAKSMTSQFRNRLQHSHDAFSASLKQLELRHFGRLEKKKEQRMKVRKVHAPKLARLALDCTSLRDTVLFGVPQLGREIGRGQYGVVYSCESWGGYTPCAVKSVVPPDDKHWNDLALQFHYTRSIPEHDRVVALRGSVIDHNYGGGYSPAVLLLMDRMQRDLHAAIKGNLDFPSRLQVACDVVEGLRYLHSLGLVHKDVKLKNVLLDRHNRGKITVLGFCKLEAMISGSFVGTPIHMAPELFSGKYDNSVDVYAFGILLWYVCAGHVKLPTAFEQCQNKDHLSLVKRGVRPEKLAVFGDKSWSLMSACWAGEIDKRPFLGEVQDRLVEIRDHAVQIENKTAKRNDTM